MNHPKKHSGSPACGSTPQICNNLRNLRFPKSATFVLFAALCAFAGARAASAQETPPAPPTPYRYQLVTDGVTIWPLDTVATKASVNAATNQVATVEASVADLAGLTETLGARVDALEAQLDDLGEDGVWALEGYVNSIGLLTGTPEYDGTIEIVHLTVTPSAADTSKSTLTLWAAFDPAPIAASQVAMVASTTPSPTSPTPAATPPPPATPTTAPTPAPSTPSPPISPSSPASPRSSPPRAPPSASATTCPSPAASPSTASTASTPRSPPTTAPPSSSRAASSSRPPPSPLSTRSERHRRSRRTENGKQRTERPDGRQTNRRNPT